MRIWYAVLFVSSLQTNDSRCMLTVVAFSLIVMRTVNNVCDRLVRSGIVQNILGLPAPCLCLAMRSSTRIFYLQRKWRFLWMHLFAMQEHILGLAVLFFCPQVDDACSKGVAAFIPIKISFPMHNAFEKI